MNKSKVVFVWENFGPMHMDRCEAVARSRDNSASVVGIELAAASDTYHWPKTTSAVFTKMTLFPDGLPRYGRSLRLTAALVRTILALGPCETFFCHYERHSIWLSAAILRLLGRRVYVMNNSRFEEKQRHRLREFGKMVFFLPYNGALVAGGESKSYLQFLGVPESRVALGYNTLSNERIRRLSAAPPAPEGVAFSDRHFSIVARFVPKKNLVVAIEAYRQYSKLVERPRALHIAGYGPHEGALRKLVCDLGLSANIVFRGALQIEGVSEMYATTLVAILTSMEEQFGNVIIEAQAMGLPVVISDRCGAWDVLVRTGVNGFVVEPDNASGFAYFMSLLSEDEALWTEMALAAQRSAKAGDVERFREGVDAVIENVGCAASARD